MRWRAGVLGGGFAVEEPSRWEASETDLRGGLRVPHFHPNMKTLNCHRHRLICTSPANYATCQRPTLLLSPYNRSSGMVFACNSAMKILGTFSLLLIASCSAALGRIGETAIQFVDRYGTPKDTPSSKIYDKNSPVLEGAVHHTYEYQGWRIRAAFLQLDGPAVRMDFQKLGPEIQIKDYELDAIIKANTPAGMSWAPMAYDNPDSPNKGLTKAMEGFGAVGQKMWRRTDGAILWSRGNIIVRLELPAAREYEAQLKAVKEKKTRESVPQF